MTRLLAALLALSVLLISCGRVLTPQEEAFVQKLHGSELQTSRIRLINGAPTRAVTFRFKPRPRVTCQALIFPPLAPEEMEEERVVTSKPAAVTFWNSVYFDRDWYLDNYLPDYPHTYDLVTAMLFAHEITHIWQWQNREKTGYSPLRAAGEHLMKEDPYLFDLTENRSFSDFGYEQQGSIMEEYVCCRALDPSAPRTRRLHAMISQSMPLTPLPSHRQSNIILPWRGVELDGICGA